MTTIEDYYNATPVEREQMLAAAGHPRTHRGPDNWSADIALSNKRAFASLAAMRNGTPRPTWGRRNAGRAAK